MEPSIFFDEVNERQGAFHRRTFLLGGFAGAGLLAMTGRLMELQLLQSTRYQTLSASNQFNFRLQPPPRGRILDRNGVEIASNRPDFRLLVARDQVKADQVDHVLDSVGQVLPLTPERKKQLSREIKQSPRFAQVAVANDLTWDEFSRVNVRAPELPGVRPEVGEARFYPYGGAFAHVIGYVSKITKDELDKQANPDPFMLHPGFRIGKQGIEKALDLELRGKPGAQKVEVDSVGRVVREDPAGDIKSTPGSDVQLTLDADIQARALEVFGDASGAAVVMDIRTGDLLCLCSAPSFDVNRFAMGVTGAEYRALTQYERKPLLDKALSGTYPPGSTFKTMTALGALQAGVDPEERVHCGGGFFFGGRVFRCWKPGGHGSQNMVEAIKNSCDVYFYSMALRAGPDRIAQCAHAFGLGERFDIGITGQQTGIVGSTEWKKKYFKKNVAQQKWFPGDTVSYGIGQGYINVNALQLCVMTARIANGKKALNPRLIRSVGGVERPRGSDVPDLPFPAEHLAVVRSGMQAVANDVTGTAYRQSQLNLGPIMMAGKTGTAQVRSYDGGNRKGIGLPWKLRDHNLFVAFAPYDDPRYAVTIIVQHGGGGGATEGAPRAREIMRVALLKDPEIRARIEQPLPTDRAPAPPAPEDPNMPAPDDLEPPSVVAPPPPAGAVGTPPGTAQ